MRLYKVVLACLFGGGKIYRLRVAVVRIACLLLAAGSLGYFTAQQLPQLDGTQSLGFMVTCCTFIVQLVTCVALFCAAGIINPSAYVIIRLLNTWPISSVKLTAAALLPGILLCVVCIGFIAPPVWQLMSDSGIWVIGLCLGLGATSALGLTYGLPIRRSWLRLCAGGAALFLEYTLIRVASSRPQIGWIPLSIFAILLVLESYLLIGYPRRLAKNLTYPHTHKQVRWTNAPTSFWFWKKIGRSESLRISLLTTFVLGAVIAGVLYKLHLQELGLIGSILALCISAFTADIRSISRKYNPPEITAVRGTGHFFSCQFRASCVWGLTACVPLIVSLLMASEVSATRFFAAAVVPVVLGFCTGLCASTLVAPGAKDISAQALTTVVAIALLLMPQAPWFSSWSEWQVASLRAGMAVALLGTAWAVEYQRNPFKWRKNNVAV